MLLRLSEFEHHFSEPILKKGLQFFQAGRVETEGRVTGEQRFTVGTQSLLLRKRGDRLLSASCTCRRALLCEHLCAVLFSLQHKALGIPLASKPKKTKPKRGLGYSKSKEHGSLRDLLQEIEPGALRDFIEGYAEADALFRQSLLAQFSTGSAAAEQVQLLLERALLPFAGRESLNQKQINELTGLIGSFRNDHAQDSGWIYRPLAVLSQVPQFFALRLAGDESGLIALVDQAVRDCSIWFDGGLADQEKEAWLAASQRFLSYGPLLYEPAVEFLLFRAVAAAHTRSQILALKKALDRKSHKILVTRGGMDRLKAVRLAVAIREAKLFKRPFAFKKYHGDPAFVIAQAEMFFNDKQNEKGFEQVLKELTATDHTPVVVHELYTYLLEKAIQSQRDDLALRFLEEALVASPQLRQGQLQHFMEMVPAAGRKKMVQRLAARLQQLDAPNSREKLLSLWLITGQVDELVRELSTVQNKFNLVHRLSLQMQTTDNPQFHAIYVQHLGDALIGARYASQQQPLFLLAKRYLDTLPSGTSRALVASLLPRLAGFRSLYLFVTGLYPHATGLAAEKRT